MDNHLIFAEQFTWVPLEGQRERFKGKEPKIKFPKILVTKLAENQEIELEVHCTKNIGKKHTKWSPVATAFYRLLPIVRIKSPVMNKDAEEMVKLCPANVFEIEDLKKKEKKLKVKDEKACVSCRACINHDRLGENFEILKAQNSYHFTVETVGVLSPERIFSEAIEILGNKAEQFQTVLSNL